MEFLQNSCSVLRDRKRTQDPVAIAKWTHLNSSRTQKLSTFTATIVGLAPAKIASCRVLFFRKRTQDPVAIAKWTHLNSSRTQKLSTFTATIVGLAPAKIASCRVLFFTQMQLFVCFFFMRI